MSLLEETLARIEPLDAEAARAATARLDSLTKPHGSLGYLEKIVRRYAAIRHDATAAPGRSAIAIFVADHGVADARVSAYPKAVTVEMLRNIASGGAAISVLARRFGFQLIVTDVGVEIDTSANPLPSVRYRRVGAGTENFLHGPAMSAAQAGVCLGGAAARVPVVVDGFIATAAAAAAEKIRPGLCDYLFFSHRSAERGHALALEALRARPILDLDLRLGEGTGAAIAMDVIGAALALFREMATFVGAGVSGKIQ